MTLKLRLTFFEERGLIYYTTKTSNPWPCVLFKDEDKDKAIDRFRRSFMNYVNTPQLGGYYTFH